MIPPRYLRAVSDTVSSIVSSRRKNRYRSAIFVGLYGDEPRAAPSRVSLVGLDRLELVRGDGRRFDRNTVEGAVVGTLALGDSRMSSNHARLTRVGTTWVLDDLNSKNGTWIGSSPVTRVTLSDCDAILVGHTVLVFREHGGESGELEGLPEEIGPGLQTLSPPLAETYRDLVSAARSTVPVAITGETGTGKELAARAVHLASGRRGNFVAINCGSLVGSLLEADLFGHKRGAYTGATEDRPGLVRGADGGTLFLDEVGELPANSQTSLLRLLQEGEVLPIGGDHPVKVDVRIVTATHRNIDVDVDEGRFRADLRARLLGVSIELLPLRERTEDLSLLVASLLRRIAPNRGVRFSADTVAALYDYDWPLNIRELERALASALAVTDQLIELHHLPASIGAGRPMVAQIGRVLTDEEQRLREKLVTSIALHEGNLSAVAREFGKDRTQIRRWMKRFGL